VWYAVAEDVPWGLVGSSPPGRASVEKHGEEVPMRLRSSTGRLAPGSRVVLALTSALIVLGTACSGGGEKAPPTYSVSVQKFRYQGFPTSIPHGDMTINFSNRENLDILHEMILLSLPSGKTKDDVIADAKDKGPDAEGDFLSFGEIGEVSTGATKAQVFDLPPGNYVFACFETGNLGDPEAKGKAHAARGMVVQFTVT